MIERGVGSGAGRNKKENETSVLLSPTNSVTSAHQGNERHDWEGAELGFLESRQRSTSSATLFPVPVHSLNLERRESETRKRKYKKKQECSVVKVDRKYNADT